MLGLLGTFGVEPTVGKAVNDHQRLALYHEEQAQLNRSQAQNWEFAADYYEKYPAGFAGNVTAAEHAAHCRAIAEDFRKLEKLNEELATKNRALMRKDVK
jgi:hypothetical protein